MGPFWDGNEVWLITAGGVTFAAFPGTYAVMFSALYTPLMLLLFALILRGVAFEFRGKEDTAGVAGRSGTAAWSSGSFLPALLLGVAFANIFTGLPLDAQGLCRGTSSRCSTRTACSEALLFVLLFAVHGALWLAIKAEGDLRARRAPGSRGDLAGAAGRGRRLPGGQRVRDPALEQRTCRRRSCWCCQCWP